MILKIHKKAQEEMVGFVIIMVIVAIILVVFLSISLHNPKKSAVESYEVEGFVQSMLQYSTDCSKNYEYDYQTVQDLIFECSVGDNCFDGRRSCDALESELMGMLSENWKIGEEFPVKGYNLDIFSGETLILNITEGEETNSYKSGSQNFAKNGKLVEILLSVYY